MGESSLQPLPLLLHRPPAGPAPKYPPLRIPGRRYGTFIPRGHGRRPLPQVLQLVPPPPPPIQPAAIMRSRSSPPSISIVRQQRMMPFLGDGRFGDAEEPPMPNLPRPPPPAEHEPEENLARPPPPPPPPVPSEDALVREQPQGRQREPEGEHVHQPGQASRTSPRRGERRSSLRQLMDEEPAPVGASPSRRLAVRRVLGCLGLIILLSVFTIILASPMKCKACHYFCNSIPAFVRYVLSLVMLFNAGCVTYFTIRRGTMTRRHIADPFKVVFVVYSSVCCVGYTRISGDGWSGIIGFLMPVYIIISSILLDVRDDCGVYESYMGVTMELIRSLHEHHITLGFFLIGLYAFIALTIKAIANYMYFEDRNLGDLRQACLRFVINCIKRLKSVISFFISITGLGNEEEGNEDNVGPDIV